ncbi:MAG: hypothetical protein ACYTFW_00385 [Planctomycetota bacterium]|jgi:hypothetical protein
MKPVIYLDRKGFKRRSLVKDSDTEDDAQYGLPAGPPDLRQLDWDSLWREMNNALADHELWTWKEVQRSKIGVTVATNVLRRALVTLYRQEADNQ